jgi:hypothetical protein
VVLICVHSSIKSQQQSPLLRLPAEIRNRICELVLGGLRLQSVCVQKPFFKSKGTPWRCISAKEKDQAGIIYLHRVTALTLVCRQLYQETHILPFKLNSVHIFTSTFSHLAAVLSDAQRNAISIARVHYFERKRSWHRDCLLLAQLGGLKRVVVEVSEKQWMSQEMLQAMLEEAKSCVEGRDVKVEFEIMSKYPPKLRK